MYMKKLFLTLTLLVAFTVSATDNTAASGSVVAVKEFTRSFPVSPGGQLTLTTDFGSIKIVGSSDDKVSIMARMRGSDDDLKDFEITAEKTGNDVTIRGNWMRKNNFFGHNSNSMDVDYIVNVPSQYNVSLGTAGGNIVIQDVKGLIQGGTSGGNLDLTNINGNAELKTSGGNIRAKSTTGNLNLRTSGGNVSMSNINGDLDVSTSGGSIRIEDINGRTNAETSGGHIEVYVSGNNKGVNVETSGGHIALYLPKNIAATIDASTSGGEVEFDLPIMVNGKMRENKVRGTINGGGELIRAHTSGGDIRILARN